jgi:3-oxoacyl-[acyl-carrier protein] reductase
VRSTPPAALPLRRARSIVNVTSVAGLGGPRSIPYAASKAALNCVTKSLAGRSRRTSASAVAPGPILTRWLADYPDIVERAVQATPQRAATPDDIADTVSTWP